MSEFTLDEKIGLAGIIPLLEAEIAALKRAISEVRKSDEERNYACGEVDWSPIDALLPSLKWDYDELIMEVGNKHEGETRHETALRYIRQAEQGSSEASDALFIPEDQDEQT